jgi:Fis family transcriptional regulator
MFMFDQNVTSPFTTTVTTPSQTQAQKPLRDSVKQAVNKYLKQLDNTDIENLYELVLAEVEAPLLEEIMTFTRGNQTRAAIMLGINRGTLRKKLKQYGMN